MFGVRLRVLPRLTTVVRALVRPPPHTKGVVGEREVRRELDNLEATTEEYFSFHDIVLESPDGTTQIDHVLASPYGVFVIETKNLSGWIFGDMRSKIWTQTLSGKKFRFQNPLRQNYKHVKAVQSLLRLDRKTIHSVVVFTEDGEFKTAMPENVVYLGGLLQYVRARTVRILDAQQLDAVVEKLGSAQALMSGSKHGHVGNVKRNLEAPTCPRCGEPMVLRKARKGRNAGNQFWGCSRFPHCRAVKEKRSEPIC